MLPWPDTASPFLLQLGRQMRQDRETGVAGFLLRGERIVELHRCRLADRVEVKNEALMAGQRRFAETAVGPNRRGKARPSYSVPTARVARSPVSVPVLS